MSKTMTLDEIQLAHGSHGPEWCGEACAVELSNLIAARKVICPPEWLRCEMPLEPAPFSDNHPSISPVIRSYVIGLNDAWGDEQRQKLKPYAAKILCTATNAEDEETRAWLAADWLVRVHTPAFLRLAGLDEHARALEGLARIADATLAKAAQPTITAARSAASAAGAAVRDAAWAAVRAAAWDAAWDAVRDAAWDAARAAAWDAAFNKGYIAAKQAAVDVFEKAGIVAPLQVAALELLDSMIAVDSR